MKYGFYMARNLLELQCPRVLFPKIVYIKKVVKIDVENQSQYDLDSQDTDEYLNSMLANDLSNLSRSWSP